MIERRYISEEATIEVEERSGKQPKLRGVAIAYGPRSKNLGGFTEIIEPGAFDHILARRKQDVVALFNHDPNQVLGRTTAGTLRLWSDERALRYEVDPLPNTQLARDLLENCRLGNISGSSFAFTVEKDGERYEEDDDGNITRHITRASGLFDVSPVTNPAYESATVSVRSFNEYIESRKADGSAEQPEPEPVVEERKLLPLTAADKLAIAKAKALYLLRR